MILRLKGWFSAVLGPEVDPDPLEGVALALGRIVPRVADKVIDLFMAAKGSRDYRRRKAVALRAVKKPGGKEGSVHGP